MLHCPGNVAYGTSKAAVAYLTKQVGCEYIQDGVVVNAVAPGRILTGREGSRIEGACQLFVLRSLPDLRLLSVRHSIIVWSFRPIELTV